MGRDFGIKPRRVGFIDEARGLDIILMVAYHAAYDLVFIFGVDVPYYRGPIMRYVQPMIAGLFIVLSGISCRYSHSNAKRGVRALLLGMALTAVTLIFIPSEAIFFGILHFMGSAMLLFAFLRPALDKLPPFAGTVASIALFALTYRIPEGYIGIGGFYRLYLPEWLYSFPYLMPLGFGGMGSDYFPLIPYLFLYFAGCYIGVFFLQDSMPGWFYRTHSAILSKIGRRTIIIYMLHQPVIMGILWLIMTLAR